MSVSSIESNNGGRLVLLLSTQRAEDIDRALQATCRRLAANASNVTLTADG